MLKVTEKAAEWFAKEFDFSAENGIRIMAKGYGNTNVHEGVSVAIELAEPVDPLVEIKQDGILFFVENADAWFLGEYSLIIEYNDKLSEPVYKFVEK